MLVKDRHGLAALGRMDELGICEAYMAGSLDVSETCWASSACADC